VDLSHEKFPDLDAYGRLKKVRKLEVDQVVDRDEQFLRDKKRINIMGGKITIVLQFSGLQGDLYVFTKIIVFGLYLNRGLTRQVKGFRALQVDGLALKTPAVYNPMEEILNVDTYPIIFDLSCIKQDLHNETP
jgi:hypothetical protein